MVQRELSSPLWTLTLTFHQDQFDHFNSFHFLFFFFFFEGGGGVYFNFVLLLKGDIKSKMFLTICSMHPTNRNIPINIAFVELKMSSKIHLFLSPSGGRPFCHMPTENDITSQHLWTQVTTNHDRPVFLVSSCDVRNVDPLCYSQTECACISGSAYIHKQPMQFA